jgi:NO-binding membrane sensor protein with MHYT domain
MMLSPRRAQEGRQVDQVHHFTYGWITPAFAFAMSFLGSLLGLISTARARAATDRRRRAWLLVLAAWAIGGTGIWVMHFMAMIGFSVTQSALRYDVPITVASFLIAVVTVGLGLFIVGFGRPSMLKVLIGGPITGVSVAFMHYTGMAAMRFNGTFEYDKRLYYASYAIAVVAATVALWFTVVVRGATFTVVAAAVMGVAVCGMHYTGMSAMRVHVVDDGSPVGGVDVNWFLAPIVLFVIMVVIALASAVMAVPSERDEARLRNVLARHTSTEPPRGNTFGGTFGGVQARDNGVPPTGGSLAAGPTGAGPAGGANPGTGTSGGPRSLRLGQTFASRASNVNDPRRPRP